MPARRPRQLAIPSIGPPSTLDEWRRLMRDMAAVGVRVNMEWQRGLITEDEMWDRLWFTSHLWTRAAHAVAEMTNGAG